MSRWLDDLFSCEETGQRKTLPMKLTIEEKCSGPNSYSTASEYIFSFTSKVNRFIPKAELFRGKSVVEMAVKQEKARICALVYNDIQKILMEAERDALDEGATETFAKIRAALEETMP